MIPLYLEIRTGYSCQKFRYFQNIGNYLIIIIIFYQFVASRYSHFISVVLNNEMKYLCFNHIEYHQFDWFFFLPNKECFLFWVDTNWLLKLKRTINNIFYSFKFLQIKILKCKHVTILIFQVISILHIVNSKDMFL